MFITGWEVEISSNIFTCASLALLNLRVEKSESLSRTCAYIVLAEFRSMQKQPYYIQDVYQTFSGHHANVKVGNVGYRKIQSRTAYSPATQNKMLANFCPIEIC